MADKILVSNCASSPAPTANLYSLPRPRPHPLSSLRRRASTYPFLVPLLRVWVPWVQALRLGVPWGTQESWDAPPDGL